MGIIGQRFAQRVHDADVIHDQAVAFAVCDAIGSRNRLHQGVRLQHLIQIKAGKGLHVEACQPHGADENHAERMIAVFEILIQLALLHLFAVGFDIEPPFLEGLDFVLLLTDDDRHLGFLHPLELARHLLCVLLGRGIFDLRPQCGDFLLPVFLNEVIHAHARDLVQADDHRFAARPERGIVMHKILGDAAKAVFCGQNVNFFGKFAFQFILLRGIEIGGFDGFQNFLRDLRLVKLLDFIRTVFVIQRNGRAVIHSALEIVDGQIAAERPLGDVVVGKERRAREADARRRRKQLHHVVCENAVLAAVRFIRHDDDIVIRKNRLHIRMIEFLNQCENKARVAPELGHQILAAGGDEL